MRLEDYGLTAEDWPLMDNGFKSRFDEPSVKGHWWAGDDHGDRSWFPRIGWINGILGSWYGRTLPYKAFFFRGYYRRWTFYLGLLYGRYLQFRFNWNGHWLNDVEGTRVHKLVFDIFVGFQTHVDIYEYTWFYNTVTHHISPLLTNVPVTLLDETLG